MSDRPPWELTDAERAAERQQPEPGGARIVYLPPAEAPKPEPKPGKTPA